MKTQKQQKFVEEFESLRNEQINPYHWFYDLKGFIKVRQEFTLKEIVEEIQQYATFENVEASC